jgi:8-oxo-dGTP pyrophosphatase MutT (NUDIX family)
MGKTIAAGIFLINKNMHLLICHPTNHKPNFWSIPKGKVDDGEYIKDAALRETYEETNIQLNAYFTSLIKLSPVTYSHKKKEIFPFVLFESDCAGLDLSSVYIKCNSNVPEERGGYPEMDAYKWVTLDEASNLLHETQVASLESIKKIIQEREVKLDL